MRTIKKTMHSNLQMIRSIFEIMRLNLKNKCQPAEQCPPKEIILRFFLKTTCMDLKKRAKCRVDNAYLSQRTDHERSRRWETGQHLEQKKLCAFYVRKCASGGGASVCYCRQYSCRSGTKNCGYRKGPWWFHACRH